MFYIFPVQSKYISRTTLSGPLKISTSLLQCPQQKELFNSQLWRDMLCSFSLYFFDHLLSIMIVTKCLMCAEDT